MVSPWMEYGNLRDYVSNYPDVERYELALGVVKAVEYLHSVEMVCPILILCI